MKYLLIFAIPVLILNFGCSNNSGPGTNNNSSISSTFNAGPYLAFSDNKAFTGHLKGTIKYLDTGGNVTESDQVDQHSTETIGSLINLNGVDARAIYYYPHGIPKAIGYMGYASDTSDVMGVDWSHSYQSEEVIPKSVTIGQEWAVGGPSMCDIILQDHLNQYTASDGQSYSDVLKFSANYLDSTQYGYEVYKGKGTLFFARGIGLVEVDIQNYEHLYYFYGSAKPLYHQMASGTVTKD